MSWPEATRLKRRASGGQPSHEKFGKASSWSSWERLPNHLNCWLGPAHVFWRTLAQTFFAEAWLFYRTESMEDYALEYLFARQEPASIWKVSCSRSSQKDNRKCFAAYTADFGRQFQARNAGGKGTPTGRRQRPAKKSRLARSRNYAEIAVPSMSLLKKPARMWEENPALRSKMSRSQFYKILKSHFAEYRPGQRRADVCTHC